MASDRRVLSKLVIFVLIFIGPHSADMTSPKKPKNVYVLPITEDGDGRPVKVNQTIVTHPDDDDLLEIWMPKHKQLESVYIKVDFKRRRTTFNVQDHDVCYVAPLDRTQFEKPRVLDEAFIRFKVSPWQQVPNFTNIYVIDGKLEANGSEREIASCKNNYAVTRIGNLSSIQWNRTADGIIYVTDGGTRKDRAKRQVDDGGFQIVIDDCPNDKRKSACLLKSSWCHYIQTCDRSFNQELRSEVSDCTRKHEFGQAICCIACCTDRKSSSPLTPYCKTVTYQEINCYDKETGTWLKPKLVDRSKNHTTNANQKKAN